MPKCTVMFVKIFCLQYCSKYMVCKAKCKFCENIVSDFKSNISLHADRGYTIYQLSSKAFVLTL